MRLLVINDFPLIGGAEQVLLNVCGHILSPSGKPDWGLHAVTSAAGPLAESFARINATPVDIIDIQNLKSRWLHPSAWMQVRRAIDSLIGRIQPDGILCNSVWSAIVVRKSASRKNIPLICAVHADILPKRRIKQVAFRFAGSRAVRGISRWIVVSDTLAKQLAGLRVPTHSIEEIQNGVTIPDSCGIARDGPWRGKLGIRPDSIVLLAMGRLDPGKGQHVLIDVMAGLAEKGIDACLIITGAEAAGEGNDGPYTRILRKQIAAADLQSRVFLTGFVEDAAELIIECDIVVSASRQESFGLAVLEGMAYGRPVVASDVAGHRTIITDGVNGFLVKMDDTQAFARALNQVIQDDDLRERLGRAARERAVQFDAEKSLHRWVACIGDTVRQGRSKSSFDQETALR